ncbi:MAG: hypothetical protein ACE5EA_02170 [Nitrospirota bacterium]
MEERLKVFLAELNAQVREIFKLCSSIEEKTEMLRGDIYNDDLTNSLGYRLHNLYSAYEDMFKLIVRFFENQIEDMARYHTYLLKRMLIEIEEIRPNLLSDESFKVLDELRGFRHLFRHAYGYELESERIIKLAEKSMKLRETFKRDFEIFTAKLEIN